MLTTVELEAERKLVRAAQREPRRFRDLYERSFDRIYAFALKRTGDRASAEDVTAETFRRAYQALPRFEWRGLPFSAWLFRIAANAASDHFARSGRQTSLEALSEEPSESWEHEFAAVDDRVRLAAMMERLPRDQRAVLVFRFVHDLPIQDIAREINRSEGAVKQLQFRALQRLRALMEEEDD